VTWQGDMTSKVLAFHHFRQLNSLANLKATTFLLAKNVSVAYLCQVLSFGKRFEKV
jgi:hypothetical protein